MFNASMKEISVHPTSEEWERALRLTEKGRSMMKKSVYTVLLIVAAVNFAVAAIRYPEQHGGGWLFAVVAVLLIAVVWAVPPLRRKQQIRSMEDAPPLRLVLTAENVRFVGDDTVYPYEQLHAVTDGTVWAMELSDCLIVLPIRVLEAEWAAFLQEKWGDRQDEIVE